MIIGSINTPLEQNLPVVTFMKEGLLQNCWINFRLLCLINSKWPRGNNNSHNCWRSAAGTRSIWFHELFTVKRLTKLLPQIPASQEQNTQDLNVSAHWLQITSQRNLIPSSLDRLPSFSLVISCDLLCENRLKVTENSVACCCWVQGPNSLKHLSAVCSLISRSLSSSSSSSSLSSSSVAANSDAVPAEWWSAVSSSLPSLPNHRARHRRKVREQSTTANISY